MRVRARARHCWPVTGGRGATEAWGTAFPPPPNRGPKFPHHWASSMHSAPSNKCELFEKASKLSLPLYCNVRGRGAAMSIRCFVCIRFYKWHSKSLTLIYLNCPLHEIRKMSLVITLVNTILDPLMTFWVDFSTSWSCRIWIFANWVKLIFLSPTLNLHLSLTVTANTFTISL